MEGELASQEEPTTLRTTMGSTRMTRTDPRPLITVMTGAEAEDEDEVDRIAVVEETAVVEDEETSRGHGNVTIVSVIIQGGSHVSARVIPTSETSAPTQCPTWSSSTGRGRPTGTPRRSRRGRKQTTKEQDQREKLREVISPTPTTSLSPSPWRRRTTSTTCWPRW